MNFRKIMALHFNSTENSKMSHPNGHRCILLFIIYFVLSQEEAAPEE
jgi:hypothetical protein